MSYEFEDQRYYPSNASGKWRNERASTGDMRTSRLREFLEQSKGPSELDRLQEISKLLDEAQAMNIPNVPGRDTSIPAFLKEMYGGLDLGDVTELPGWLLQKLHGALGVDATRPPGIEDAMGFAGAVGPLKGTAAALTKAPKKDFGIKKPVKLKDEMTRLRSEVDPRALDHEKWDAYDIATNLDLGPEVMDAARIMLSKDPRIGYRIAADPKLQQAIKEDPDVLSRLGDFESWNPNGMNYENPNWSTNPYARSTGRAAPGEPDWFWKGGFTPEDADLSKAGWALEPSKRIPETWQSKLASPIDSDMWGQGIEQVQKAGAAGMRGIRSVGESLGELGSEISNKAVAAIPAANRTRLEDLMETYGWLMPVGGVAGAGALLSKLLPPLPSTSTAPSKYDTDPNYRPRDINDPEGMMTSQRRQQMQSDSPWKVASEIFPWNW